MTDEKKHLNEEVASAMEGPDLYRLVGKMRLARAAAYLAHDKAAYAALDEQLKVGEAELGGRMIGRSTERSRVPGQDVFDVDFIPEDDPVEKHWLQGLATRAAHDLGMPSKENEQVWKLVMGTAIASDAAQHAAEELRSQLEDEQAWRLWGAELDDATTQRVADELRANIQDEIGRFLSPQHQPFGDQSGDDLLTTEEIVRVAGSQHLHDLATVELMLRRWSVGSDARPIDYWLGERWESECVGVSDQSRSEVEARHGAVYLRYGISSFVERDGHLAVAPGAPRLPELIGSLLKAEGARRALDDAEHRRVDEGDLDPDQPSIGELDRVVREMVIDPALADVDDVRRSGLADVCASQPYDTLRPPRPEVVRFSGGTRLLPRRTSVGPLTPSISMPSSRDGCSSPSPLASRSRDLFSDASRIVEMEDSVVDAVDVPESDVRADPGIVGLA